MLAGGNELILLCVLSFLYGRRPKFFYYLFAFVFDKFTNGTLKMWFHNPRPTWVDDGNKIKMASCNETFGKPSNHSEAVFMISIMLILDIFHGSEQSLY